MISKIDRQTITSELVLLGPIYFWLCAKIKQKLIK